MNVLLITTGRSQVLETLEKAPQVQLYTLDCKAFPFSRNTFRSMLEALTDTIPIDLLLTYRCPYLIPTAFLVKVKNCVNIHPSLLPECSGLNPWEALLSRHRDACGITIHRLSEEVDSGEMLLQERCVLTLADTLETAREKTDELASTLIQRLLPTL